MPKHRVVNIRYKVQRFNSLHRTQKKQESGHCFISYEDDRLRGQEIAYHEYDPVTFEMDMKYMFREIENQKNYWITCIC